MTAIHFNGPRTLVSRHLGSTAIQIGDEELFPSLPVFVPSVPIGQGCVPTKAFLSLIMGNEATDDLVLEFHRECRKREVPPVHTQALITEEMGCIDTISTSFAVIEMSTIAPSVAEHLQASFDRLTSGKLEEAPASFESLSLLHQCAGKPRSRGPGHWYRWRGKEEAEHFGGKGVWRTSTGEWMASHGLALSHAHWLFPKFLSWTCRLMAGDPRMKAALWDFLGSIGAPIVNVRPEPQRPAPASHLRLVHDADQQEPAR